MSDSVSDVIAAADGLLEARSADPAWDDEGGWSSYHGTLLEPALTTHATLGAAPIRLVDARFLVRLKARGARLPRRQDIPDPAFLSLSDLRRMPYGGQRGNLRLLCISHTWFQPDHPDPRGDNLGVLARVLEKFIAWEGGTWAVFLDFCSLHQHGRAGEARNPDEAQLFSMALGFLAEFYSHERAYTLKLTTLPHDYPQAFTFSAGTSPNTAAYADRGWCFCESMVSNLVKANWLVLDLGKLPPLDSAADGADTDTLDLQWIIRQCRAGRRPPLTPEAFSVRLATKKFTNGEADLPKVNQIYERACELRLSVTERLFYSWLDWGDEEVVELATWLGSAGVAPCLKEVWLRGMPGISESTLQLLRDARPDVSVQTETTLTDA